MKKLLGLILFMMMAGTIDAITVYDREQTQTRIGGYMDTEWKSEGQTNTFKAHRFILQAGSRLNDQILFNSEVEFEYGGFIKDGGNGNKGELKIEQAWVDYQVSDAFTFRSGIVLIPVGQLNIFHDSDMRDFTDRPLVNKYIIPTTWMDAGFGGHGTLELGDAEISLEAYITNGLKKDGYDGTKKGNRVQRPNFKADSDQSKAISARVGYSPNLNTTLGLSGYAGSNSQKIVALDGRYNAGAFGLKGELASYDDASHNKGNGFYVEASYNIAPMVSLQTELNLLARYDVVDTLAGSSSAGEQKRISVGFNIRPHQQLVYKFEYHINDIQGKSDEDNTLYASVAVGF